ncbi:MAG: TonB-dependent receptor [Bryobacteraceae bacterium]|nr:TonB-dependent receptor [Bryobacteraceae bacterium]
MRLISALLACAAAATAQVSSGVLFGDVQDQSGALVSGCRITATHRGTGFARTAASGLLGEYRIDELPPGSYRVMVEKAGFRTLVIDDVAVEVNQKRRLAAVLTVGAEPEQVTVVAEASLLRTGDASEGHHLEYATTQALPLAGRNIISLATIGPGAVPRQLGGFVHDVINDLQAGRGEVALNPPVNGARSTMNAHVIDGAYSTDRNTYVIATTPPLESVQEFRIQTALAPAQAPHAGGAVIDVVTKSGAVDFHGNVFEYFRNESMDARGFFDDFQMPRPIFRQNQFGGTLGGPLPGASTFFFATYEGLRGKSARSRLHVIPDAGLRSGNFAGRSPIFDPLDVDVNGNRRAFADNRLPASRIDPIASRFLERYQPLPNRASPGPNFLDATPNTAGHDSVSTRVDRELGANSRLFARYTINDERRNAAGSFPQRPTSERLRAQQAAVGYTRAGANWVNEARLAFTRLRVFNVPESAFGANVIRELGIEGGPDDPFTYGLPYFAVTNVELVTDSPTLPQVQRDNTWFASDSFSLVRGRHAVQFGFQWIGFQLNYLRSQFPRGQYIYTGAFTADPGRSDVSGDAFADFLLGFPQTTRRFTGDAQAYLRNNNYAVYLQEDLQISPSLMLNAGVRYEYFSPFSETRGNLLNLDYSALPAPPELRRVSRAAEPDRNNIAPRLGLAWRLPGIVFRAGYGLYYSPEIAAETYDLARNNQRGEINQVTGPAPTLTTRNGFPQTATLGLPTYFGLDPWARTPYVQQWTAGIQRQLPGDILAEAAYVGTKGTRLGRFRTFNTPLHVETGENLAPRPGELQSLRTFPQFGPLFQRQHISNSIYHSLQLRAEKRFRNRLSFLASFVWAKSIDDADTIVPGQYDSFGAQDERNLRLERGLSFFDVRRRFSAAFLYQLPRPGVLRPVFSNWELSGIVTLQDGTPLNPVYFILDFANSGTPNRPDVVPGRNVRLPPDQRSIEQFFNREAFSAPAPFTFGNAGRNILPGPGNNVVDLALRRLFTIRENHTIQLRVEAFNAFNRPNLGIPGPYPDFGPFFGRILAAGEQRRLQLGARYDF